MQSLFYAYMKILLIALLKILFRFRVFGKENFRRGAALIASNHNSFLDPPVVGAAAPEEIHYIAREDLMRHRIIRWFYSALNLIPVKRDIADVRSIRTILQKLKEGKKVLIFPEGQRSYDGELQSAKAGIGFLVCKAEVPIIPAYTYGTYRAMPRGRNLIYPTKLAVVFGKPIYFDNFFRAKPTRETYKKISDIVMEKICELKKIVEKLV